MTEAENRSLQHLIDRQLCKGAVHQSGAELVKAFTVTTSPTLNLIRTQYSMNGKGHESNLVMFGCVVYC